MNSFFPDNYWTLAILIVTPATLYASIIDYRERRVPNRLNAALALTGIFARFGYEGWSGVQTALTGILVGFGVLIIPWMMHAMGAGEVASSDSFRSNNGKSLAPVKYTAEKNSKD